MIFYRIVSKCGQNDFHGNGNDNSTLIVGSAETDGREQSLCSASTQASSGTAESDSLPSRWNISQYVHLMSLKQRLGRSVCRDSLKYKKEVIQQTLFLYFIASFHASLQRLSE